MVKIITKLFRYSWPSVVIAAIIFYLSCLMPGDEAPEMRIPYADKIVHFLMYFGLSLVASIYYIYKKEGKIIILKLLAFAIALPILYGGIIEVLQAMFFDRTGDWYDFLADTAGSLATFPISLWFRRFMLNLNDL